MCFEFQQTEVYPFMAKPSMKPMQVRNPQRCSSLGLLSEGLGWPLPVIEPEFSVYPQNKFCASGCGTGLPTVPCQRVYTLTWRDQLRVRKWFALHVHLMLLWLAETGHACCGWSRGFQVSRESSPFMEATACQLAVYPSAQIHEIPRHRKREHFVLLNDFSSSESLVRINSLDKCMNILLPLLGVLNSNCLPRVESFQRQILEETSVVACLIVQREGPGFVSDWFNDKAMEWH